MHRRKFLIGCAGAGALDAGAVARAVVRTADAGPSGEPRSWPRALLVDPHGSPLAAARLPERRTLLFHYPFVGTPAFLLDLGRPTRQAVPLATEDRSVYRWAGGVGRRRSIVAFSAICAHRLAYPTREITFINFRSESSPLSRHADVIHCCSEHSQYDPAEGARVLAGPARQPLAAILLEHDPATDRLHAVGTQGGELFDEFFTRYPMKLSMEYGGREHDPSGESCIVEPIEQYSRQVMRCG